MSDKKADKKIELFIELSQVLTGQTRLDSKLASEYYDRIKAQFKTPLKGLLSGFEEFSAKDRANIENVSNELLSDDDLAAVAKEITMLWYMAGFQIPREGEFDDEGNQKFKQLGPETPEQNFQALIWPTIHAHPLGLSGGYFGYWHYPPEN